jgi:murein DD-endopeptidase MepM/ murein hydrolase activator NlpD
MKNNIFIQLTIGVITLVLMNAVLAHSNEIPLPPGISVSSNGTFMRQNATKNAKSLSENGQFWYTYDIGKVGDEVRELRNFKLYKDNHLLYSLEQVPGSDVYISNSGIVAFLDHSQHFQNELTVHFYSKDGRHLFSETFTGAFVFGFSSTGNCFGVGTPDGLSVISVLEHRIDKYAKGFQFNISEDESMVAVASEGKITVYEKGKLLWKIATGFEYTRKVKISSQQQVVAAIEKGRLQVYSIREGSLIFQRTITGNQSYRDLMIDDNKIVIGIHYRDGEFSKGIVKAYDWGGDEISEQEEAVKRIPVGREHSRGENKESRQDPIPWMFSPFDSMRTVWNYYEQHMGDGGSDWSYLHQGLDLIVPIGEPVYAVETGIVKCVLTIGGNSYWRTAISPEQSSGWSDGWLYAHLIHNTIQFEVGDSVHIHDYLGNIVEWTPDWGHIHFVQIHDSGMVWFYDDNEWGINFNPLLALEPDSDGVAPVIENVFPYSKFGFCTNETSNYLPPDSLSGDIDIIVKAEDYVGASRWQQPAFCSYYWLNRLPEDTTVFPRTLGHILNHTYPFYETTHFEPYATVLYKRDALLLAPSWMDTTRNYYHILTNNNGDSLIDLSEANLAFPTENYPAGNYRLFVQVYDEWGNSALDSQDVRFRNGTFVPDISEVIPREFQLEQNYPNPFNPATIIHYSIPQANWVTLTVYDVLGRRVEMLVNQYQLAGGYAMVFEGDRLPSGIYFCRLRAGDIVKTRKMILMK